MKSIIIQNQVFLLNTNHLSMMFQVNQYGHLEHIHFGKKVRVEDAYALSLKRNVPYGDSLLYDDANDATYCLDTVPLEYSTEGKGDTREPALSIRSENGMTTDFHFASYEVLEGSQTSIHGLPTAYGASDTLIMHLRDSKRDLRLDLIYSIYPECDVFTRRAVLINEGDPIAITKMMSFSMDLIADSMVLMTFNGGWASEMHRTDIPVNVGTLVSKSNCGFSSSRTNPGFIVRKKETNEYAGAAYGFNLIWSGDHYASISSDSRGSVRIMAGISNDRFSYELKKGEFFETPEAFMTYSANGLNDLSHHFHSFINNHVVRGAWKNKERPVLVNDWEAYMFDFDEEKLVHLAEAGKEIGAELFVLDDGWFSNRNSDYAGLGDYHVNLEKLPSGITGLAEKIHGLGMMFGLWFEPEAINIDSLLYGLHPEWVLRDGLYEDVLGRHELLLDLRRKDVQDYIIENVSKILDEAHVDYVKWDMNRLMAGQSGESGYAYILGLYRVLGEIFGRRPEILFESCSSGGNRFDAGMLCYSQQVWSSDDTDAIERLDIQKGYSYLYPQSVMGAHVSASPNAQTGRSTPFPTRFHISAFGQLGYELDVFTLDPIEIAEAKNEIAFYKKHRQLLQYGIFNRGLTDEKHECFSVVSNDHKEAIASTYRRCLPAAPGAERLQVNDLSNDALYEVKQREALIPIGKNSPFRDIAAKAGTLISKDEHEGIQQKEVSWISSGSALSEGILLNNVFNGSGYHRDIRFPQDFGSEMFWIKIKD